MPREHPALHDFELRLGSQKISYQIFSKDYVFREGVPVKDRGPVRLSYRDPWGGIVDRELAWKVEPK